MISVIISTYNPNLNLLNKSLEGLKKQELSLHDWELIIIDNNSDNNFHKKIDLSWHGNSKIIIESKQGLTFARLKGFEQARGEFIIMVDDDNILHKDYLKNVLSIFKKDRDLGAFGGKSLPIFEVRPPTWIEKFYSSLALRDLGEQEITENWSGKYTEYAPIGAGMAIRKIALTSYISKIDKGNIKITDRLGSSLSSGGDNDIVLEILKSGWKIGYFPSLLLHHIIPSNRITQKYLSKLTHDSNISWMKLLSSHKINPWAKISKKTLLLRYFKAYLNNKAWKSPENYIRWRGACGMFKGLSEIE